MKYEKSYAINLMRGLEDSPEAYIHIESEKDSWYFELFEEQGYVSVQEHQVRLTYEGITHLSDLDASSPAS